MAKFCCLLGSFFTLVQAATVTSSDTFATPVAVPVTIVNEYPAVLSYDAANGSKGTFSTVFTTTTTSIVYAMVTDGPNGIVDFGFPTITTQTAVLKATATPGPNQVTQNVQVPQLSTLLGGILEIIPKQSFRFLVNVNLPFVPPSQAVPPFTGKPFTLSLSISQDAIAVSPSQSSLTTIPTNRKSRRRNVVAIFEIDSSGHLILADSKDYVFLNTDAPQFVVGSTIPQTGQPVTFSISNERLLLNSTSDWFIDCNPVDDPTNIGFITASKQDLPATCKFTELIVNPVKKVSTLASASSTSTSVQASPVAQKNEASTTLPVPPTDNSTPTPTPTPQPPAPPDSSSDSSSFNPSEVSTTEPGFVSQILNAHNGYRSQHGAAALSYSNDLAQFALSNAQTCSMEHTGGNSYGENLASASNSDPAGMVGMWYAENQNYDYSSGDSKNGAVTGHFTQLVWKATSSVGCAWVPNCGSMGSKLTCEYSPPGNVAGQYTQNVS